MTKQLMINSPYLYKEVEVSFCPTQHSKRDKAWQKITCHNWSILSWKEKVPEKSNLRLTHYTENSLKCSWSRSSFCHYWVPYKEVQYLVAETCCLLTELFFLMRQNMLLRIRAHIIRSFCSCKCMWRWCKTTGRRIYRESEINKNFYE